MAKVLITQALQEEIYARFKGQSVAIFQHMKQLEEQPQKGKIVGTVGGILIKEIKYLKFRFYCIADGHVLKFGSTDELAAVLVKFVRMSEKKDQQFVINEIKAILRTFGLSGF